MKDTKSRAASLVCQWVFLGFFNLLFFDPLLLLLRPFMKFRFNWTLTASLLTNHSEKMKKAFEGCCSKEIYNIPFCFPQKKERRRLTKTIESFFLAAVCPSGGTWNWKTNPQKALFYFSRYSLILLRFFLFVSQAPRLTSLSVFPPFASACYPSSSLLLLLPPPSFLRASFPFAAWGNKSKVGTKASRGLLLIFF